MLSDKATDSKCLPNQGNVERQLDLVLKLVERGDLVLVGRSNGDG